MNAHLLAAIITRELRATERELNAYATEEQIWELPVGLPNSGGTLALHIAGNLQHFVGAVLGGSSYVRDRDAEFQRRNVPRAEMVEELRRAEIAVRETLQRVDDGILAGTYPLPVANRRLTTSDFLMHLATHLAYHVGQLDFHRRIVTGDAVGVGVVSPTELASARPIES
jgi:uncharacterized damage-inducible protein DinB